MSGIDPTPPVLTYAPRSRRLSLRRNFSWTFFGNVAHALSQWLILSVFAKFGSPEAVGTWGLGLAIANPITVAAMLHLRQVQVTDVRNEYRFEHYFGLRTALSLLAVLLIAGIAIWGPFEATARGVILLVGLAKGVDAVSEIIRGLFQRYEQMNISGLSLVIRGPLGVAVLAGTFVVTGNQIAAAAALVIAWLLVVLCYDVPFAARLLRVESADAGQKLALWPNFAPRVLRGLFWRALPLGVGMFLLTLAVAIPRYFLAQQGLEQLGYYDAAAYAVLAAMMLISPLGQSAAPRLAHYFATNLVAFRRLFWRMMGLALVLGGLMVGGAAILGKQVLRLLYTADYAEYHTEFMIMSVAVALLSLNFFGGVGLAAARRFVVSAVAGLATLVVTTIASFGLVPTLGVRGAAIALVLGHLATVTVYFLGLARALRVRAAEIAAVTAASGSSPEPSVAVPVVVADAAAPLDNATLDVRT